MFNLAIKDYQISAKTVLRNLIIVPLVFIALALLKDLNIFMVYFFAFFITFNYISAVFSIEEKNHSEIFILSFPVGKTTIVYGRYLSSLLAVFFLALLTGIMVFVSNRVMLGLSIDINAVLVHCSISIFINGTFMSLLLPLMYKFGYTKATEYSRLMLMCGVLVPITLKMLIESLSADSALLVASKNALHFLQSLSNFELSSLLLLSTALLLTLSILASKRFISNKA